MKGKLAPSAKVHQKKKKKLKVLSGDGRYSLKKIK